MIAGLKPYPEHKESGLPWVGRMPAHWSQRRMKFLFQERAQKGFPDEPLLAATQTKGVVRKEDYGERTVTVTKDFHLLKLVETGDFVISLRSFEGGIEVAHCRGIISPAYTILAPRLEARRSYYTRFFKSPDFIRSLTLFVTGIREGQNIDYERLSRAYMPLPPAEEQDLMGRFLDYANGRLERAIRAKRKVIALLHEQKQAIIHRAVTRGLDPTVPLKPSGIPWLGDFPKHWELTKLKHLSPQITVGIVIQPARLYVPRGVPCLRSLNISSGRITTDEMVFISEDSHRANRKSQLNEGDVVLVRTGRTGVAVIVPPDFHRANCIDLLIIRKTERLLSEYLLVYFQSYGAKSDIAFNSVGAIQAHYNTATLANLRIPLPSIPEQQAILRRVETDLAPLNTAITRFEREIQLLGEYRTRLVADVVTGKLDVRGVILPAEFEPPAALAAETIEQDSSEPEEAENPSD